MFIITHLEIITITYVYTHTYIYDWHLCKIFEYYVYRKEKKRLYNKAYMHDGDE